ncbi:MAG: hypothetical protein ACK5NL_20995, partial [Vibrio fluvialis]
TEFYDSYLTGAAKLLTCTYSAFAAQVALTGNCAKFALDADNQKFKVPLLKDGDSITQAANAAEIGKSVKAGLPNITAEWGYGRGDGGTTFLMGSGAVSTAISGTCWNGTATVAGGKYVLNASTQNSIYGNSTTVTDEQVRLRHFIVVASAQNNASIFDWSAYMAGLVGKLNADLSNKPSTLIHVIESWTNGVGWYRKWSDGFIEQGGKIQSLPTGVETPVTLWTPFVTACVYADFFLLDAWSGSAMTNCYVKISSKTTISIAQPSGATRNVCWYASGY